jgi:L-seryl-tRNA(Ser) seleniumtransferase
MAERRSLPSVDSLIQTDYAAELAAAYGRPLTVAAIRSVLQQIRDSWAEDGQQTLPDADGLLERARQELRDWTAPSLQPVINASGVILHTNLGRAPLSAAAISAMDAVSRGYSTLEFDLATGKRGSRLVHAEALLTRLTGAEAAVVVNNNAAAVLLALSALAKGKRVAIARSQLVEIGGGFRVPDVMRQSGARLVEVGTTNRVRVADFEEALQAGAGLVLRAHPSNFKIIGFTEEPSLDELAAAAHAKAALLIDDLGSGCLLPTEKYGLAHEPTVQESLRAGADLVCFSGDKLLGGPQAGILLGRAELLATIKKHPLARAVRADKTCLAGLSATLLHYLKNEAESQVPVWRMLAAPVRSLRTRAAGWATALRQGEVVRSESTIGGGSLPGETLPTYVLALDVRKPDLFLETLRRQNPPVIARTEKDRILLDPRTVLIEQEGALLVGLANALKSHPA